jgi:AcrR family transcriptional regulator
MTTREKLIRTASDLFYRDGFHLVGVDRIIAEAGVTKTTFYNHFEGKDDLIVESLRVHDRWWRDEFLQMLRRHGGDSARGQLLALFDSLAELFDSESYHGCFFINAAVEFPLPHDPAHVAALEHKRAMTELIRELAAYAGAKDPAALAREISMVLEGAYVTRQVDPEADVVTTGRALAAILLDRHCAA